MNERAAHTTIFKLAFCKIRQRGRGAVLLFADHENDMQGIVALEPKRLAAKQLVAGRGRADSFLDVFDDQFGSAKMIHIRPAGGVVHGIRQVADEQHVFPVASHVAQAKRSTEDAHVCVHSDEHHILDAMRLEQVPDFKSVVADGIALGIDVDQIDLPLPWTSRVAPNVCKVLGPGGVFHRVVVFASVGVVDGVALFFLHLIDPVTPVFNRLRETGRLRCIDGPFARGVILIKVSAGRRRMDDERTLAACLVQKLVHARCQFAHPADGVFAVVQVPHVADDDSSLSSLP